MPLKVNLIPTDLVQRDRKQLAFLKTENPGRARSAVLSYRIQQTVRSLKIRIPEGAGKHVIPFPSVKVPCSLRVDVEGTIVRAPVEPPRTWHIHLVNHTHTDLGYTDYHANVNRDFYLFILEAMALVEQTKSFPEAARFRWTNETAYHLQNFLNFASPTELRKLIPHLRAGTIDTSPCFLNMTDLPDTEQVIRSFRFIRDFSRKHRFPLRSGMVCDINGLPWVYPAALSDLGVHNLSMSINHDMARCPLNRPMPFWWASPDARRVLVWHGEIYLYGNRFGVERSMDACMDGVGEYLRGLDKKGYAFDHVLMLMSGAKLDCAPPTIGPCLTTRDWNERFANPTMRMATMSDWFAQIRKVLPDNVPVYPGHWPDYWAHGLGSAADEIRYARETQHLLNAAQTAASHLSALDRSWKFPQSDIEKAYADAALAGEHTFGAFCSIREPESDFSKFQWQAKRDHFYRARLASELALKASLERIGRSAAPGTASVVVHNAMPWQRDGLIELTCVQRPLPGYTVERIWNPESSRSIPHGKEQRYSHLPTFRFHLKNVPAAGYRVLPVVKNASPALLEKTECAGPRNELENRYYRIRINARTGQVESIRDKKLKRELVKRNEQLPFGRIIQERLPGPEARAWANDRDRKKLFNPRAFRRTMGNAKRPVRTAWPGLFQEMSFDGTCRGLEGLRATIRLHEKEKRIDFAWRLTVPDEPDPQAAYVAFPFSGARPRVWLEVPGAAMEPGIDQIPTTCYDFYTVQNFVRIETGSAALTLVPLDTPLVQLNEISTFRFRERLPKINGTVVAWLFNNYWHTNFPATQPGEHLFRFSMTSGSSRTHDMAAGFRFAYETANPLRAAFVPESPVDHRSRIPRHGLNGSFVMVEPENVILLCIQQAGQGRSHVIRLQETAGKRTPCVLRFRDLKPSKAFVTDLYGGRPRPVPVKGRTIRRTLAPRELVTLNVVI